MNNITLSVEGKEISLSYNEHFSHLAKINQSLHFSVYENYQKQGLTYMDVPEVVGITGACENVDTLFKVQTKLNIPLFFTQTGQLSLEQALQSFHGVCTTIHSGRDEDKEDERHLRQFRLTEEEFDCTLAGMSLDNYDENKMFEALLSHIQSAVQAILKGVLKDNSEMLRKVYKRHVERLEYAAQTNFLRIAYEDAVSLLNKNGYSKLTFGDDLKSDHEAKIVSLLNKKSEELPVFITHYPKEIKFFNMKQSLKDSRVVMSADLILPYAGEATGSAVREHDFEKLNERLTTSTMFKLHTQRGGVYEDFLWYLNIVKKKGSHPHAGYGIGNERVIQYILGESDIRRSSLFSMLNKQTGDWDKKHYGQIALVSPPKLHILLTIGKLKDKEFLLPYVKKLVKQSNVVLYATEKTHQFLKRHSILSMHVYKVSEIGQTPNIADLLSRRVFNLIINTPNREKINAGKAFTDGKLIRKAAVRVGVKVITDLEIAGMTIDSLIA